MDFGLGRELTSSSSNVTPSSRLADGQNTVHVWDLNSIDPRLKLPYKDAANSLFGTVTYVLRLCWALTVTC